MPDDTTAETAPACCGGGDFFGHEPFCDCGHVRWERAIGAVVQAAKDIREHMLAAHPQQDCASCSLRLKGLSEALGALESKDSSA
jgi:hypothetical protein